MKIHFKQNDYDSRELEQNSEFSKLKNRVIAYGPNFEEKDEAFAFEDNNEFIHWARQNAPEAKIDELYKEVEKAKQEIIDNESYIKTHNLEKTKRIRKELEDLAKHTGFDLRSKELFVKATTNPLINTGAIFDSVIIYEHINFQGEWRGVGNPEPNLTWYPGWNDTISSLRGIEHCILFEHIDFNGRSRTFWGPYFEVRDLRSIGFNDVCSSIFTK